MWYPLLVWKRILIIEAEKDFYEEKSFSSKALQGMSKRNRIEKNEAVVPRGKERRKRRKNALRQVPVTTLILLIALTFVYISFCGSRKAVRRNKLRLTQVTENADSSIQKAVLFQSDEKLKEHYKNMAKRWDSLIGRGVFGGCQCGDSK